MAVILKENKPDKVGKFYCYFDDFPYDIFLPEKELERFNELYVSDHILDDKEFAELERLAEKAVDIYDSLPD